MNVAFINPFLAAVVHVLQTMAFTETRVGKPCLKGKSPLSQGDVTGIVGLIGEQHGSLAVSFSEAAILQVVSNMFGEECKEINDEVRDAVGELTNMICGDARRILAEQGHQFQAAIPTVIDGKGHKTSVTQGYGTPGAITTTFAWQGDLLLSVTDPNGDTTTFGYDEQGRVVSMTDPLDHTAMRSYDEQGHIASITNRNGLRREFSYDEQGRLVEEAWYAADGLTDGVVVELGHLDQRRAHAAFRQQPAEADDHQHDRKLPVHLRAEHARQHHLSAELGQRAQDRARIVPDDGRQAALGDGGRVHDCCARTAA